MKAVQLRNWVSRLIPGSIKEWSKKHLLRWIGWKYYCPVCQNWLKTFTSFGVIPRPNARCPKCGSLERHRLAWVFLSHETDLFDSRPKTMLHIAPEPQFEKNFKKISELEYVTADLYDLDVMIRMDIEDIPCPDNSFDVIYCSHVLEHVPNDRKSIREMNRILKPNGWAIFMVPITVENTIEDPSVTDPTERLKLYGQKDHVRRYGLDFPERLKSEGFHVKRFTEIEVVGKQNISRFGINSVNERLLFFVTKRTDF